MPETRYVDTYVNGVLVSHEPYEVSDVQLAAELAVQRNDEMHQRLGEGGYVVISNPPADGKRIKNIYKSNDGRMGVVHET